MKYSLIDDTMSNVSKANGLGTYKRRRSKIIPHNIYIPPPYSPLNKGKGPKYVPVKPSPRIVY